MYFKDRTEAGKLLAQKFAAYRGKDVIVYALPRGGVVLGVEIAKYLKAPLDLILARKIGHPGDPEYALGAISENGYFVRSRKAGDETDEAWLQSEISKQKQEILRRRAVYGQGRARIPANKKVAILVDDGIATGLSIRVAIADLKHQKPEKIILAVPIIPESAALWALSEVDICVALEITRDEDYLGSVGAYYEKFPQLTDKEVRDILRLYDQERDSNVFLSHN